MCGISILALLSVAVPTHSYAMDPPFGMTVGGFKPGRHIAKGEVFDIQICLHAFQGEIKDVSMIIELPREVHKFSGDLAWRGDLQAEQSLVKRLWRRIVLMFNRDMPMPEQERCILIGLESATDMNRWSSPISAVVDFQFEGDHHRRILRLSKKGVEDSGYQ